MWIYVDIVMHINSFQYADRITNEDRQRQTKRPRTDKDTQTVIKI